MTYNFLMIARVLYDKGYSQYVEAAKRIHHTYPLAKFQLLGDIDLQYPNAVPEEVVKADDKAGIIEYLGYHKDVRKYIKKADCLVHPTYYNEGLSRVLMEGLAMQKSIITTDIPGCKEMVDESVNGFLCQPKDVDSLVVSIEKFITLTAEERILQGLAGRKKVEAQFDVREVIKVYHSITDAIRK
jgi:glycosyltransferase involved in cell wall biosynthesis